MESLASSDAEILSVDHIFDESSGTNNNSAYSEKSEVGSIGQLQHEIKMLSIKVLEKDIEIRNLKAEPRYFESANSKIKLLPQSLPNNSQSDQVAEFESLRRFLIEHEFTNPHKTFMTIKEYDQMNQQSLTDLKLIDLVKFRHFQLCLSLQKLIKAAFKVTKPSNNAEVQTMSAFENELGVVSSEKRVSILKKDNCYLTKQLSVLEEKLHCLERNNQALMNDLKKAEDDRTSILERALKAEESRQTMQRELRQHQESYDSRLPLSLFEQFRLFEALRNEREFTELNKKFSRLHAEQDALTQCLRTAEAEMKRLREELHAVWSGPGSFSCRLPSDLTKSRIVSLEMQLTAATAARNDALRQVEQLTEKFEAASKAVYELDAARKVEVSRLEADLSVASHKLAAYERLEAELDQATERLASNRGSDSGEAVTELLHLTNVTSREGVPLLPILASRRLEHCIRLSRRIARVEEIKQAFQTENEGLKRELQIVKAEAKRASELVASMDKPTNGLAAALMAREMQISNLQSENRRLEEKLRQLYDCTKDILTERNAMLADLKSAYIEMNQQQSELSATQISNKHLPRKISCSRS